MKKKGNTNSPAVDDNVPVQIFCDTEAEEVRAPGDKPGLMKFTVSTEDRDRHGDVVVAAGWKLANFKKNPVMLWAHDYSRPPIGKAVDIGVEDGKLRSVVEFVPAHIDPFAEQVRQLYLGKFMRTTSVGFQVYKREPLTEEDLKQRPEQKYGDRLSGELLEFSAVPVPANPLALQNGFMSAMAKSFEALPSGIAVPKRLVLPTLHPALAITGTPELRHVRARAALAMGARGVLNLTAPERDGQLLLLAQLAGEMGDPSLLIQCSECASNGVVDQSLLREAFADVWDNELLDLVADARALVPAEEKAELSAGEEALFKQLLEGHTKILNAVKALK